MASSLSTSSVALAFVSISDGLGFSALSSTGAPSTGGMPNSQTLV